MGEKTKTKKQDVNFENAIINDKRIKKKLHELESV